MEPREPDLSFLNYTSHPFIRRALRTRPRLKGPLANATSVTLAMALKSSGLRHDSPTTVLFREGPPMVADSWRTLDYVINAVCAIPAITGTWDRKTFDWFLSERAAIEAELKARYEVEKRPVGSVGGGPGAKEIILYLLVKKFRPKVVVETGVANGISSRYILTAMDEVGEGRLESVDLPATKPGGFDYQDGTHDPVYVPKELGVGWLVPERLRGRWNLHLGRSDAELPKLSGPVDLFLHDSEHSYETMMFEFNWGHQHLVPGGFLGSDDAPWSKAWKDFLRQHAAEYTPLADGYIGFARRHGGGA